MMNIAKLMKQAQQLQSNLAESKEKLASEEFAVEAAGGKINIVVSGSGDIKKLTIDPSIIDPDDAEFLQEVLLSAIQDAQNKARERTESEMSKITGGMGLPPGLL